MKNWNRYNYYLRIIMNLVFLTNIINNTKDDIKSLIFFTFIFIVVIINDSYRMNKLYNSSYYYISFLFSLIISSFVIYFISGYIDIYLFMLLIETAYIRDIKIVRRFYILTAFMIFFVPTLKLILVYKLEILEIIQEGVADYLMMFLVLGFNTIAIFSYRALIVEKSRVERLNKEIEELTITEERNRVAQEIHDNLGHNLIALNMNLDVAGNMVDVENNELREIIDKCQNLTKESVESLRMAVYALRDERLFKEFISSVEELINNITSTSNIKIDWDIDDRIEDYPANYKNVIYTSIKESLTNSIKHGKVSRIYIELKIKDEVFLIVSDNGIGCKDIVKSNGLIGIEERVKEVQGSVEYITEVEEGFKNIVKLPVI